MPRTSFTSSWLGQSMFPCEAGECVWHRSSRSQLSRPSAWGPSSHVGVSERTDSKRGEGTRAAGSCIWFLSVMILRGGQTVVMYTQRCLAHTKRYIMLPGRRHGAVVSYIRRAFCLDCRVASALPLHTVHGSLYPLPWQALRSVGGELAGADTSHASCLQQWCTWVRAPTI